eukprot:3532919-Amphidinium_carterae.1
MPWKSRKGNERHWIHPTLVQDVDDDASPCKLNDVEDLPDVLASQPSSAAASILPLFTCRVCGSPHRGAAPWQEV